VYALAWLFMAIAVGSLLLGLSRAGLTLIYVSIGASVMAVAFLLAAVLRRPPADTEGSQAGASVTPSER
jgi:hypothetical protein